MLSFNKVLFSLKAAIWTGLLRAKRKAASSTDLRPPFFLLRFSSIIIPVSSILLLTLFSFCVPQIRNSEALLADPHFYSYEPQREFDLADPSMAYSESNPLFWRRPDPDLDINLPENAHYLNDFAINRIKVLDLDRAENLFRDALNINPHAHEIHLNLARLYMVLDLEDRVAEVYENLALWQDAPRLIDIAEELEATGREKEAEILYRAMAGAAKGGDLAFTRLGFFAIQRGNFASALRSFENALNHDPDYAAAHFGKGTLHYLANDYERALPHLQKAHNENPATDTAIRLAEILLGLHRAEEALELMNKTQPKTLEVLEMQGRLTLVLDYSANLQALLDEIPQPGGDLQTGREQRRLLLRRWYGEENPERQFEIQRQFSDLY